MWNLVVHIVTISCHALWQNVWENVGKLLQVIRRGSRLLQFESSGLPPFGVPENVGCISDVSM
jgi:hypothetical protein